VAGKWRTTVGGFVRPWNLHSSDAGPRRQPSKIPERVAIVSSVSIRRRLDLDGDAYECDGAATRPRRQADARTQIWWRATGHTGKEDA
jgi:hypothetical protein